MQCPGLAVTMCFSSLFISVEAGKELVSPCLAPSFKGEWEHAEITYRLSGQKAGTVWIYLSSWGEGLMVQPAPSKDL